MAKSKEQPIEDAPIAGDRAGLEYEALSTTIREQIAASAEQHGGGSIHEPAVVAYEALNYFDAYRYYPWFRLIVETAAK